jgi:hypothetical protein
LRRARLQRRRTMGWLGDTPLTGFIIGLIVGIVLMAMLG